MFQFSLHAVESGFCIIKLNLPVLRPLIVFSKGRSGVFQSGTERLDFLLLGLNLLVQDGVSGGQSLHRVVIFIKLGGNQPHLRTEDFERGIDVRQGFFEFLFALKPDFQTKIIRQTVSPPQKWHEKRADFSTLWV